MDYNIDDLEEYYKNPIMESWTYVSIGMDNLKYYDPDMYHEIEKKQILLLPETEECLEDIRQTCERLNLNYLEVKSHIEQFLQKFPLALRRDVGWDDPSFIFLYVLTRMLKPKVIIETGSNIGFSSTFIALAVKENNNGCRFYTMEPAEFSWESESLVTENYVRKQKINYDRLVGKCEALCIVPSDLKKHIIFKKGYSKDILPDLLKENKEVDIFFHDSEHSYRVTLRECATVIPYMKEGGYILVHDVKSNQVFKELFGKRKTSAVALTYKKEGILGICKIEGRDYITKEKQWVIPSTPIENSLLNDNEYRSKKIKLNSSPQEIIIQTKGCSSLSCVFCSENKNNEGFDFDYFFQQIEPKISSYISQAKRITFKSCGRFFQSSEVQKIINLGVNSLETSFPEVNKTYYTTGLDLVPKVCEFITKPIVYPRDNGNKLQNIVNILLYASNAKLYKTLTGKDIFSNILTQIKYLAELRKDKFNPAIHLTPIITTLNIEDLPNFVKLASTLGIDKIICQYSCIYKPTQKYLSCFFKQKITNEMLDRAEELAKKLNIEIELPPRFDREIHSNPESNLCNKAWSQIIIDTQGNILTCDTGQDCNESLQERDFMDVWNGHYYQNLRESLTKGNCNCFKYCIQANPACVNDFRSHIICHGRKKSEIDILWADNF